VAAGARGRSRATALPLDLDDRPAAVVPADAADVVRAHRARAARAAAETGRLDRVGRATGVATLLAGLALGDGHGLSTGLERLAEG
jgi:muconolactone delta-isomerase